jgi:phosphoribosylamine--glycine ligase
VLGVTATASALGEAISRAYTAIERLRFEGMHYRTDIARKGIR